MTHSECDRSSACRRTELQIDHELIESEVGICKKKNLKSEERGNEIYLDRKII